MATIDPFSSHRSTKFPTKGGLDDGKYEHRESRMKIHPEKDTHNLNDTGHYSEESDGERAIRLFDGPSPSKVNIRKTDYWELGSKESISP